MAARCSWQTALALESTFRSPFGAESEQKTLHFKGFPDGRSLSGSGREQECILDEDLMNASWNSWQHKVWLRKAVLFELLGVEFAAILEENHYLEPV